MDSSSYWRSRGTLCRVDFHWNWSRWQICEKSASAKTSSLASYPMNSSRLSFSRFSIFLVPSWMETSLSHSGGAVCDLRGNLLYGTVPPSLFNYSWKHIPPKGRYLQQMGNASPSRLVVVDLAGNYLSGTIPSSIGLATNLRKLDLSYNRFEGTILFNFGMLSWIRSFPILNIDVADAESFLSLAITRVPRAAIRKKRDHW
jgi:hypothetical protein